MNYMDCKTLSEIAEVQTNYAVFLFAVSFRTNQKIANNIAMTRACMASVSAWWTFEDIADKYLKSLPVPWSKPEELRNAA